jgi:hypothetical protein
MQIIKFKYAPKTLGKKVGDKLHLVVREHHYFALMKVQGASRGEPRSRCKFCDEEKVL